MPSAVSGGMLNVGLELCVGDVDPFLTYCALLRGDQKKEEPAKKLWYHVYGRSMHLEEEELAYSVDMAKCPIE